jgi:Dullard-like phosphatase family protein
MKGDTQFLCQIEDSKEEFKENIFYMENPKAQYFKILSDAKMIYTHNEAGYLNNLQTEDNSAIANLSVFGLNLQSGLESQPDPKNSKSQISQNLLDNNIFEKKTLSQHSSFKSVLENFKINFDYVESSLNHQGNYHYYVSNAIRSLTPLMEINYTQALEEYMVNLPDPLTLPGTNQEKKTLILDLDETLIHADFDNNFDQHDHIVTFIHNEEEVQVPIILRPGLFKFLESISENFEVFIFTASKKEYADAILNYLDPENKFFKQRFYRENCINVNNRVFIKDLRIFNNRKIENIVILDNSLYSFTNQLSNGILINSFYNDQEDSELNNVYNYLQQYILGAPDARVINEQIFNFRMIFDELSTYSYDKKLL